LLFSAQAGVWDVEGTGLAKIEDEELAAKIKVRS
jgi:hypothetical protein